MNIMGIMSMTKMVINEDEDDEEDNVDGVNDDDDDNKAYGFQKPPQWVPWCENTDRLTGPLGVNSSPL